MQDSTHLVRACIPVKKCVVIASLVNAHDLQYGNILHDIQVRAPMTTPSDS